MVELIPGRATAEGTAAYRQRLADRTSAGHFREQDGRWLSSLGLGTYLGDDDEPTDDLYRAAIVRAPELGVRGLTAST